MIFSGEIGTVTAIKGNKVNILFNTTDACEDCGLKIICAPGNDNSRVLTLDNPGDIQTGQQVRVEEISDMELHLALAQFGLPMLLFLAGLLLGYYVPLPGNLRPELTGFIVGLIGLGLSFPLAKGVIRNIANQVPEKYLRIVSAS